VNVFLGVRLSPSARILFFSILFCCILFHFTGSGEKPRLLFAAGLCAGASAGAAFAFRRALAKEFAFARSARVLCERNLCQGI